MQQVRILVGNSAGLHTRPAMELSKIARTFRCAITLTKGKKSADAKSLVELLKLGIFGGSSVLITVEGEDEKLAIDSLVKFIRALED